MQCYNLNTLGVKHQVTYLLLNVETYYVESRSRLSDVSRQSLMTEPSQVLSLSVTELQYSSAVSSTRPARRRLSHNQSCRIVTRHELVMSFSTEFGFTHPCSASHSVCVCVSQTGSQCRKNAIELCLTVSDEDVSGCLDQEPSSK